jgi:hypothetical protein
MLMSLLEVWLTVVAWRKGWRARALVPLAATVISAMLIGFSVGLAGGSIKPVTPVFLLLEFACLGVLIAMATRAPKVDQSAQTVEAVGREIAVADAAKS